MKPNVWAHTHKHFVSDVVIQEMAIELYMAPSNVLAKSQDRRGMPTYKFMDMASREYRFRVACRGLADNSTSPGAVANAVLDLVSLYQTNIPNAVERCA